MTFINGVGGDGINIRWQTGRSYLVYALSSFVEEMEMGAEGMGYELKSKTDTQNRTFMVFDETDFLLVLPIVP